MIYRNLPENHNQNQDYYPRRTNVYNPSPLSSQRVKHKYYSIKSDLDAYQMMEVTKLLPRKIPYFEYQNKIYAFKDLKWEVLHSKKNRNPEKTYEEIFQEKMESGADGTQNLQYQDLLSYQQKILKILFYYFILKLNILVRKSGYSLPYHDWTNYFISDYQIIRLEYHQTLNLYKYILMVEVHRDNKHHGYIFDLEMLYKPAKMDIWISEANLRGIQPQDQLAFRHLGSYKKSPNLVGGELSKFNDQETKLLGELYDKLKNFNFKEQKVEGKSYQAFLRDFDKVGQSKCFKPGDNYWSHSKTSNDCLSYDPIIKKVGVWDKECQKDEECPFFQANKNYKNSLGECRYGRCQLPIGMNRIGFKHYTKDQPICYNCHKKIKVITADGQTVIKERDCSGIECNKCCEWQRDKELYPNLESPDYAFPGDLNERLKNKKELDQKELGIQNLIIEKPKLTRDI